MRGFGDANEFSSVSVTNEVVYSSGQKFSTDRRARELGLEHFKPRFTNDIIY